jgi:hypothetical protein
MIRYEVEVLLKNGQSISGAFNSQKGATDFIDFVFSGYADEGAKEAHLTVVKRDVKPTVINPYPA